MFTVSLTVSKLIFIFINYINTIKFFLFTLIASGSCSSAHALELIGKRLRRFQRLRVGIPSFYVAVFPSPFPLRVSIFLSAAIDHHEESMGLGKRVIRWQSRNCSLMLIYSRTFKSKTPYFRNRKSIL
jgi:hypothetical protein